MRKIYFISVVSLVLLVISGCGFMYADSAPEREGVIDMSEVEREEDYQWRMPEFEAQNQYGELVTNKDTEGEKTLVKTIFTRCPTVCMTMTPNMVLIQEAMVREEVDGVNIVSFTVDPEFDTPERLEDYAHSYGADLDNWTFITGYEESFLTDELAPALFTVFQPVENDILHPTRFYLFNEAGDIIRMYEGDESFNLDSVISDLKFLQN